MGRSLFAAASSGEPIFQPEQLFLQPTLLIPIPPQWTMVLDLDTPGVHEILIILRLWFVYHHVSVSTAVAMLCRRCKSCLSQQTTGWVFTNGERKLAELNDFSVPARRCLESMYPRSRVAATRLGAVVICLVAAQKEVRRLAHFGAKGGGPSHQAWCVVGSAFSAKGPRDGARLFRSVTG
jgi:hypothetical protein